MKITIRDLGIFLLGVGILLFSLVFLHMYVTKIMPQTNFGAGLSVFCDEIDNKTFALQLNMYNGIAKDVKINLGNRTCNIEKLVAGSSYVCTAKTMKNALIYNVTAKINGEKIIKSGVCKRFAYGAKPLAD